MAVIISYGLFRTDLNVRKTFNYYVNSLKRNSDIYSEFIPNSTMVLYHDDTVPNDVLDYMKNNNVVLKEQPKSNGWEGTFWRFKELANADDDTVVILQDADSALDVENGLIRKLSDMLLESENTAFIHHGPVSVNKLKENNKWLMAGQSMYKKKIDIDFDKDVTDFLNEYNKYDADEIFLGNYVWPLVKDGALINIERRALPLFLEVVKNNPNTPKWLFKSNHMDRIITNLTAK
jgi:hypothetical protein